MERLLEAKRAVLAVRLEGLGSALIGLSGGVDSSLLVALAAAHVRGPVEAAVAITPFHPDAATAREAAARLGVRLHELRADDLLDEPSLRDNPPERCYLCKRAIFSRVVAFARERGLATVLEGSNADDLAAFRPGRRALAELGVLSPLAEAGFAKREIRALAAELGLAAASRPADACSATRFPYGTRLTEAAIARVRRAEAAIAREVAGPIRVRAHGDLARIEVDPAAIPVLAEPAARERIRAALREAGFAHVSLDLVGYRSGAMDEALTAEQRRRAAAG